MSVRHPDLHASADPQSEKLLRAASGRFDQFAASLQPLHDALTCVDGLGHLDATKAAAKIRRQIERFEPSVTMIGQIKSGKTTLVNAMVGMPDLLPADVNPWTSVVTSLHLCPRALTPPTRAKFRFFDNDEWDRLVKGGGRIGDLANRAGADDELSKILAQAEEMREKARERLGRKFELLLGGEQDYGYFDRELIERYVCLGDGEAPKTQFGKSRGYFADITRSADLFMQQAALPINLCIRDTPGVNDTFMVREQITIKAIRDSRICVVVLSAHQALSSTDLALIRLISNVKSREVIIFVNRIDELSDPARDVALIRDSIAATLADHKGPEDAQVIFGSALWAKTAAGGPITDLPKASQEALFNWAEVSPVVRTPDSDPHDMIWQLSGLPALFEAIAARVAEGEGAEMLARCRTSVANLLTGVRAADNLDAKLQVGQTALRIAPDALAQELTQIQQGVLARFDQSFEALRANFHQRVDRAHESFLARATEDLAKHLEFYGEKEPWSYDPAGLRILLQSGYKIFGAKSQGAYQKAVADGVSALQALSERALGLDPALYTPQVPQAPHVPPPVAIGQTIALDLRGSWWKGWWMRRKDYMSQAQRFQGLVRAETQQLVSDLKDEQAGLVHDAMHAQLAAFLIEQAENMRTILSDGDAGQVRVNKVLGLDQLQARDAAIATALTQLEEMTR